MFSQSEITFSKLTIETLQQGVKFFKINGVALVSLLLTLNIFHIEMANFLYFIPCSSVFIVNFEPVNTWWVLLITLFLHAFNLN